MISLLIKASIIMIVLLGFYKLVLERESFFSANRAYLLLCLVLACSLPFVALPQLFENQGMVSSLIEPLEPTEEEAEPLPRQEAPVMEPRVQEPDYQRPVIDDPDEYPTREPEQQESTR